MSHVTKAAGIKDFYDPAGTNRLVKIIPENQD